MALTYNIENHIEIGKAILVKSLLRNTTFSVEEIAGLLGLQVDVVEKVKNN